MDTLECGDSSPLSIDRGAAAFVDAGTNPKVWKAVINVPYSKESKALIHLSFYVGLLAIGQQK